MSKNKTKKVDYQIVNLFQYPERDLNPHSRNGQRILSPSCLPFHHPGGKQKILTLIQKNRDGPDS